MGLLGPTIQVRCQENLTVAAKFPKISSFFSSAREIIISCIFLLLKFEEPELSPYMASATFLCNYQFRTVS